MAKNLLAASVLLLASACGTSPSTGAGGTSGAGPGATAGSAGASSVGTCGGMNGPATKTDNQGYYQSVDNLEKAIELYSSLGLDVQVTELDLSLYIPGVSYDQSTFYTAATFGEALQIQQANRYKAFFELFRRHRNVITGVTLWGIADDNTWLSEFSSGRKDFPLLFDTNHQPKKAFDAVMSF